MEGKYHSVVLETVGGKVSDWAESELRKIQDRVFIVAGGVNIPIHSRFDEDETLGVSSEALGGRPTNRSPGVLVKAGEFLSLKLLLGKANGVRLVKKLVAQDSRV